MKSLTIRGGHVIDPANGRNEIADLYVVDGKISADPPPDDSPVISAENLVVTPGLIDMHVHFREPGQTHKETLATGAPHRMAPAVWLGLLIAPVTPLA
jgi:dihydroorotase